jgi:transglutaminase-like putative cysteine protease
VTVVDARGGGPLLDHREIEWPRVTRVRFALHQRLRYDYASAISRLHHRLMVLPRAEHGDQHLLSSAIDVAGAGVDVRHEPDGFGNLRYDVRAERVEEALEFEAWALVERRPADGPTRLPAASLTDPRLLQPTPLTWPDRALAAAARLACDGKGVADLSPGPGPGETELALARRINAWVHHVMRYRHDVTNVDTTAARALGLAQGVCQDYAHVMLAVCRLAGLPARYVSGHLLGEGGSHAWVEVVVPSGSGAVAVPFDPTHGRQVGPSYLTVALGRDYADVAPTYGTFQGSSPGRLSTVKQLGVCEVDLAPARSEEAQT